MGKRRKITPYKLDYWFKNKVDPEERYLLVEDLPDDLDGQENLDWWKRRLRDMDVAFSIAVRAIDGEPHYSIFSEQGVFK